MAPAARAAPHSPEDKSSEGAAPRKRWGIEEVGEIDSDGATEEEEDSSGDDDFEDMGVIGVKRRGCQPWDQSISGGSSKERRLDVWILDTDSPRTPPRAAPEYSQFVQKEDALESLASTEPAGSGAFATPMEELSYGVPPVGTWQRDPEALMGLFEPGSPGPTPDECGPDEAMSTGKSSSEADALSPVEGLVDIGLSPELETSPEGERRLDKRLTCWKENSTWLKEAIDDSCQGDRDCTALVPNSNLLSTLPASVTDSLDASQSQTYDMLVDDGCMLGKTFRVGWGPRNIYAVRTGSTRVTICRASLQSEADEDSRDRLRERVCLGLRTLHAHSECHGGRHPSGIPSLADSGHPSSGVLPSWRLVSSPGALSQLTDEIQDALVGFAGSHKFASGEGSDEKEAVLHEACTWELVKKLFAEDMSEEDPMMRLFRRRANVGEWLALMTKERVLQELDALCSESVDPGDEDVFLKAVAILLSGHNLFKASVLSASRRDSRLAALLSVAGGYRCMRDSLRSEVGSIMKDGRAVGYLPERLGIYQLLMGNSKWIEKTLDLDWRQSLGIYLWYVSLPTASISDVLDQYSANWPTDGGTATPPFPSHSQGSSPMDMFTMDTQYELLRLYATRERQLSLGPWGPGQLLQFSGYSSDPLDCVLSWQLLDVLKGAGVLVGEDVEDSSQVQELHLSMISLCESLGLHHWAVFVAMHMPDGARGQAVYDIICRNAGDLCSDPEMLKTLRDFLAVPAEWLAEAQAIWYRSLLQPQDEFEQLVKAGIWGRAHYVFCRYIVAQLPLDVSWNSHLWAPLRSLEQHSSEIVDWHIGGGVYDQFCRLMTSMEAYQDSREQLVQAFSQFKARAASAEDRWAVAGPHRQQDFRVRRVYRAMVAEVANRVGEVLGDALLWEAHPEAPAHLSVEERIEALTIGR